ncbi:MAG: hypothetical protein AABZ45_09110 [Pseudomonadota bacterium]
MKLLRLLRNETTKMMLMGFAVGAIGLTLTQPSTAHADAAHMVSQAR